MVTDDDARMVAERLGLGPEDTDECQRALEDIATLGQEAFEDHTLREAEQSLKAAYAGQRPTDAIIRRAQVRKTIAIRLREFTELRALLVNHQGPAH
jgi:hypothetical protein